jgi:hypothetical protein
VRIALHVHRRIAGFELPGGIGANAGSEASTPDTKALLTYTVEALRREVEGHWLRYFPPAPDNALPLQSPSGLVEGAQAREQVKLRALCRDLLQRVLKAYPAFGYPISGFCIDLDGIGGNSAFPVSDVDIALKAEQILGWTSLEVISVDVEGRRRFGRLWSGQQG